MTTPTGTTPTGDAAQRATRLREKLESIGQEHLLAFADDLPPERLAALCDRIESLRLDELPSLVERYVQHAAHAQIPGDLEPASYYPADASTWDRDRVAASGEALLRAGKVACFTVAGGQGTRLGFDGPKGCLPTGAVTGKPLFQIFAEQVLATGRRYGVTPRWSIMTSPLNHDATVAFFRDNDHFGLDPDGVSFFQQGVMPAFDERTGRVLLAEKDQPATSPDGHGGAVRALHESGELARLAELGVEHLSYTQVDNPHAKMADPVFIGLHATAPDSSAEMSSKMLPKADPDEKVGVFCRAGGKARVIEYSDLPAELAQQKGDNGELRFIAGSIAIHMIGVNFLRRVATEPELELPFHRAHKKVPHIDTESGARTDPDTPNAIKLERFVFDAIPLAESSIVVETDRVEEFAPVKNKTGVDSIDTSRALQTERAARWLERAGVAVPRRDDGTPDCALEISPLTALDAGQLREHPDLPASIEPGASLAI
mgnify:FL=1